jgi:hypothetical protein
LPQPRWSRMAMACMRAPGGASVPHICEETRCDLRRRCDRRLRRLFPQSPRHRCHRRGTHRSGRNSIQ